MDMVIPFFIQYVKRINSYDNVFNNFKIIILKEIELGIETLILPI